MTFYILPSLCQSYCVHTFRNIKVFNFPFSQGYVNPISVGVGWKCSASSFFLNIFRILYAIVLKFSVATFISIGGKKETKHKNLALTKTTLRRPCLMRVWIKIVSYFCWDLHSLFLCQFFETELRNQFHVYYISVCVVIILIRAHYYHITH